MGLRKHKALDDSQHKLQKKVSPIKSSGLLVTPQKPTVVKATAAAKRARFWSKNNRRRLSSSSPIHRSGHVLRSSRFQRQVILFLVVLFYHSENQEFSSTLTSAPLPIDWRNNNNNNTTITGSQQQQERNGIGRTLRNARTHSLYSWIPKGIKTGRLTISNNRTAPIWKETLRVAQDTSVAIVHQSQKVVHEFGSISMTLLSFRWVLPPKWKPQPLKPPATSEKSERKLLWLSSSSSPPSSLSAATMDKNSLPLLSSLPQQYLRAPALSPPTTTTTSPYSLPSAKKSSTTTTPTTTAIQPLQQVLLARLWQQASTPAQKLLQSLSSSTSTSFSPLMGGREKKNKIRDWVDKIYGASITTHPYYYESHPDSSHGAGDGVGSGR